MKYLFGNLVFYALLTTLLPPSVQAEPRKPFSVRQEVGHTLTPLRETAAIAPDMRGANPDAGPKVLLVDVPIGDVGFADGFRLSNLGGRREVYIPIPQGVDLNLAEFVLAYDDVSAHDARRSLEILVNDRSVAALALDGKSNGRIVRVPFTNATARDGFLKLSFLYSGAATQDRCIDVRYVGDSVTVRAESAVEFEIGTSWTPNIAATAALMPQNVAILLSGMRPTEAEIEAALTLARSLSATGKQVTFHHGVETLQDLVKRDDRRRWVRGLIIIGAFDRIADRLDTPLVKLASATRSDQINNTLAASRIDGVPVLLLTDRASARVGRLLGNPSLASLRDTPSASVGEVSVTKGPIDRVSFDSLGVVPAQAEVFGRAELTVAIPRISLPTGTKPSRLILDLMVAPDSAGEKAVVSVFVNERLLASTVAAIGEPTRLDFALPDGLIGSVANIRTIIQRRSSQGDCRFEPQGYPAQILGSSSVILSTANPVAEEFSDLATLWSSGIEVLVPTSTAARPLNVVGLLAEVLNALLKETAPIVVKYVDADATPTPDASFIVVGNIPPAGAIQRVRFDRGRTTVKDRAGRTRLDIGGLATGAVAQLVTSGTNSGLWIKPLTSDGSLPVSPAVNLDRGNVAFLDKTGVALALSTERDTLLQISYPDQTSWLSFVGRFGSWIIGGVWVLVTVILLFTLQRIYRRGRGAVNGS